jgi:branched-chain amino acid transport system permease protein
MSVPLFLVQLLNGLELGMLLFLVSAGLTLIFGVMGFISLAHGALYMVGAYLVFTFTAATGSFFLALILVFPAMLLFGLGLDALVFRHFYDRDHLDQVLVTFGLIVILDECVKMIWGRAPLSVPIPASFSGSIVLMDGLLYPVFRLAIIGAGLLVAVVLSILVSHTRAGMLVRAGATSAPIVAALGVNIRGLFMLVFGVGAMLAGFAGSMAAPIFALEPGMGDAFLILAFVVIVTGGIGSVRGAFIASLLVGLVDTLGRSFATDILKLMMSSSAASRIGPALASMSIYLLMAAVLFFRPAGLFPASGRT